MADLLPNGIGGLVADSLITAKPLQIKFGRVWYVHATDGDDTNSGRDRKFAKATLKAAVDAAQAIGADHLVVCMAGHSESPIQSIVINERMTIVGEGATAGVPSVKLNLFFGEPDSMIEIQSDQVEIRNIHFTDPTNVVSGMRYILGNAAAAYLCGCHFDMPATLVDRAGILMNGACDYWRLQNCIFTAFSTVSPVVSRPFPAIQTAAAIGGLTMDGVTFDGGEHGFDNGSGLPYAFDASIGAVTAIRSLNMSLLRGADFKLHTDSRGYVSVPPENATGHAKVEW